MAGLSWLCHLVDVDVALQQEAGSLELHVARPHTLLQGQKGVEQGYVSVQVAVKQRKGAGERAEGNGNRWAGECHQGGAMGRGRAGV
jgi:hypothetical protein